MSWTLQCAEGKVRQTYYNSTDCSGQYFPGHAFALGTCAANYMSRGMPVFVRCNNSAVTVDHYSSQPKPAKVACPGRVVSVHVNSSEIDQVSFEVGHTGAGRRPFFSFTKVVEADEVSTPLPGLPPLSGGLTYRVWARTHRRGGAEGDPTTWAELLGDGEPCPVIGGEPAKAPAASKVPTRWVEMFRTAAYGRAPDFLDQHNTCDLTGAFSYSLMMSMGRPDPLTRYCVEVADVVVPGVITSNPDGKPRNSPYADYASCMGGHCMCMVMMDRGLSRMPVSMFEKMCRGPEVNHTGDTCRCSRASTEASGRYVGMAVVPLPFTSYGDLGAIPYKVPANYPTPWAELPLGAAFSLPVAGMCPSGAPVGTGGCTWRRAPQMHTLFIDDLVEQGADLHIERDGNTLWLPLEAGLTNIEVGREAFRRIKAEPCGPASVII